MDDLIKVTSLESMYSQYRTDLVRFAAALVGPSDAADCVSDAVLSLLRGAGLDGATHPRALLYRAVLNRARSIQRSSIRRRRRERLFADQLLVEDPDLRPDVVAAVAGLSPQQRACVYLAYWEDLAVRDIALMLNLGEGTVKRYLPRARDRLREAIDE